MHHRLYMPLIDGKLFRDMRIQTYMSEKYHISSSGSEQLDYIISFSMKSCKG